MIKNTDIGQEGTYSRQNNIECTRDIPSARSRTVFGELPLIVFFVFRLIWQITRNSKSVLDHSRCDSMVEVI